MDLNWILRQASFVNFACTLQSKREKACTNIFRTFNNSCNGYFIRTQYPYIGGI